MKKYFPHISGIILTFVLVFAVSGFLFPQTTQAQQTGSCVELINGKYVGRVTTKEDCKGTWKAIIDATQAQQTGSCVELINGKYVGRVTTKEDCKGTWKAIIDATGNPNGAWNTFKKSLDPAIDVLLAPLGWLAILILQIASLFTYLGGVILNFVVQWTVVEMAQHIKEIGTIDTAWKAIRDVANMGFIFILLYAAIQTILGIGSDTKKLIVNIVVVAILINFSLFFTKVVIDASNVLAVTFYDAIAPNALPSSSSPRLGLSGSLMEPLQITSLWKADLISFKGKQMIIVGLMGTIVSLIAAFVFFAVAVMFVIRFVVLIFVMILSPLAFMGYILPQLKKHKDEWVQALLGQAFFAPIYFMLTWIVIIISRGLLKSTEGVRAGGSMAEVFKGAAGADGNFVTNPSLSSIAILVNFIVMIVFLIASLVIAKQWANKAGHGVPGLTKWATGLAGGATLGAVGMGMRSSLGSRAAAMANDEELKKKAAEGSIRARLQLAAASKAAKSSFDLRGTPLSGQLDAGKAKKGGFIQDQKDRAKAYEKYKPDSDLIRDAKEKATQAEETLEEARKKALKLEASGIEKTSEEFIEAEKQLKEAHDTAAQARLKRDELNNRMKRMADRIEKGWGGTGFGGIAVSAKDKASAIRAAAKGRSKKERLADLAKEVAKEEEAEEETPTTPPPTPSVSPTAGTTPNP